MTPEEARPRIVERLGEGWGRLLRSGIQDGQPTVVIGRWNDLTSPVPLGYAPTPDEYEGSGPTFTAALDEAIDLALEEVA